MALARRRFLARLAGGLAAGIALSGLSCTREREPGAPGLARQTPAPASPQRLVLYSPEDRAFVLRLAERFTRESGVEVSVPPLGRSGTVFWAMHQDLEEGQPQADIVYGGGPFFFYWLDMRDLLERDGSPRVGNFPPGTWPPYWRLVEWTGFRLVTRGLALPPATDLWALPSRAVPLVIPDPRRWDYGTMLVLSLLSWYKVTLDTPLPGWAWLREVHRRPLVLAANPGGLASALSDLEQAIALVPHHLLPGLRGKVAGLESIWPDQVPLLPNPAARARRAPHPRLAERFLDWLGSPSARDALLQEHRLPAACDAASGACAEARLVESRALPLNVGWAFENYNEVRREWDNRVR